MKKLFALATLAAAIAGISAAAIHAQRVVSDQPADTASAEPVNESTDLWFVELSSPPTTDGTGLETVRAEKAAFRRAATVTGLRYSERYAFDTLWNGLSIRIDQSQIGALRSLAGVRAVYPVESIALPEPAPDNGTNLTTALAMTGADLVQNALGYNGAGIRLAVVDTGVDYDHPDLGGCFGPGCRVEVGFDFVGDAYNSSGTPAQQVPAPDPNPDDCGGHGTHVAGIAGANGGITGVAPGVTFGAYRVFGCVGTTSADVMIAAMERALSDGMDVLNMSIGSSRQWPQYPTAAAATRLVNKGVVVVASAGNDGAQGLYASSAPSLGEKVISVASFDNTHLNVAVFSISPDDMPIGYSSASGAPPPPVSGTFPLKRTGTTASTNDACNAVAPALGSLTGHVALIRRGTCGFYEKARNAELAGAIGVVIYNNALGGGIINISAVGTPAVTIPVVFIATASGTTIDGRLATGPVAMTWTSQVLSIANPTGGLLSSFSSYGVSPDLTTKPDIGAPGGLIRSTIPLEQGTYGLNSGTSMSSPHVAGAVALLLQARPHTPAQAVRSILQNSADPALWSGNPSLGFLDVVHRQGAGMLDIDDAILATTKIEPGRLSMGESEFGPITRTLTLENNGSTDVTYDLSNVNALATGPNTFAVAFLPASNLVTFSAPSVTVAAGGTASVNVTIAPNAAQPDRSLYGGYVVFTPQGGGQTYRVPYSGFKGDYQSIPALTPTANGFPWLARLVGTSLVNQPGGATYTFTGGNIPYFVVHLDHQIRRLRLEVFDAITGKAWHRVLDEEYLPRNSTATSIFAFTWDGTTVIGSKNGAKTIVVPDGQYVVKLSVLKALGSASNPAHSEIWTSPIITIDRP